ncbi:LANO_0H05886g1_1 [Lachancea nothofagi CBS 11611]|uniref:holo-[acyl-carrier-protein] synthase n=1 Tax=Lachancea nothofagi CBS 11611 TaxID=1266666 RepID=A0A1G4KLC4_9SACH|nr:LANO_0H05886g1_1 [Lachancea nothofagi CBS 11611]
MAVKPMQFPKGKDVPCVFICDSRDNILNDDFEFEGILRLFPLVKQQHILTKKVRSLRNVALCNQILQLAGISMVTGQNWRTLNFGRNMYGKPECHEIKGLAFNMSNSNGRTALYLDNVSDVGIDLASTQDCSQFDDEDYVCTFKDIFAARELSSLEQMTPGAARDQSFTHYWSLKESYTKLTGTGLNCDLSEIDIGVLQPLRPGDAVQIIVRQISNETIVFQSEWLDDSTVVSICKRKSAYEEEQIIPMFELKVAEIVSLLNSTK